MEAERKKYNLIKEMLIVYILGGSLGLMVLVSAELVVHFIKK